MRKFALLLGLVPWVAFADLPITAKIPISGGADWISPGFGSVWVKTSTRVIRINPETDAVMAEIPVGTCRGFAMGYGAVWSTVCGTGVIRISPDTNAVTATIPVTGTGSGEGSLGVGEGGIWALSNLGSGGQFLIRFDPETLLEVARVPMPANSNGVVAGHGAVWVTNTGSATVTRVDPSTNTVAATIPVHGSPRFIAAGPRAIYSLNQMDGTVSQIDPRTNLTVTVEADAAGGGGDIKADEQGIWVSAFDTPVIRLDPATLAVTYRYSGDAGDALNVGYGSVWLPAYGTGPEIWRIDQSRIP